MREIAALGFCIVVAQPLSSMAATCTVEEATAHVRIENIRQQARSAAASRPLLDEMSKINEKAKDPRKKLVDQLPPRDLSRFTELSQRMANIRLSSHVGSGHDRDVGMVSLAYDAAWRLYGGGKEMPTGQDAIPMALVVAMRQIWPNTPVELAPTITVGCSVETALTIARDDAIRAAINDPNVSRDSTLIQTLKRKYGILDPAKMSPDDRRVAARASSEMQPAFASKRLAEDLQNILDWWGAANIVFETRKEDITTYGADYAKMGTTLDERKDLSERTRKMIQLWNVVNAKFPSDEQKMEAAIQDQTKVEAAPK